MERIHESLIFQSDITSIASGRLLRANEIQDLTTFDEQTGFVSIDLENKLRLEDKNLIRPITEDGRQLNWPKTVFKRPNTTSFRNSEPANSIYQIPNSQNYNRY